jgi:hypothetical protein
MSNNVRIVKYSEDLFKIPSGTQKKKKQNKPPIKIKPTSNKTIKNKILDEIRKNQEKQYKQLTAADTSSISNPSISNYSNTNNYNTFENDFQKSVEYMKTFADKHKEEVKLNKTLKDKKHDDVIFLNNSNAFSQDIVYEQPKPVQFPTSSYGCLKNGNLPTFRNYNKTIKQSQPLPINLLQNQSLNPPKNDLLTISPLPISPLPISPLPISPLPVSPLPVSPLPTVESLLFNPTPSENITISERIKSPAELLFIEKIKKKYEKPKIKPINKQLKKILRRTYRTGKDKYRPRVGVLLSNKTIRSNVTTKSYLLKQTPMPEIRKILLKQGFIKIGSSAPDDVLRKIYESIQMIGGDINNHNPDNLLYNFFNDKHT